MFGLIVWAALVFPAHSGVVTDTAHMLTPAQQDGLSQTLRDYRDRTTNAIVVLTVPTLEGLTVEEYGNTVFHLWGIGDKAKDNGVLLLWAVKERKIRIEVGYGLEASLPDGRAGQIIREAIVPAFKQQRWFEGLQAGVGAIIAQLDREPPVAPITTPWAFPWLLLSCLSLLGGSVLAMILWVRRKHKKEPESPIGVVLNRPQYLPNYVAPAVAASRRRKVIRESYSYTPSRSTYVSSPSSSYDSGSSSSSSSSSDSGSYGGGDSGGGGASGSY